MVGGSPTNDEYIIKWWNEMKMTAQSSTQIYYDEQKDR